MKNFSYVRATSVKEAVQQASANSNSMFIAGGTNLVDRMKVFLDEPSQLIDIYSLDMTRIEQSRAAVYAWGHWSAILPLPIIPKSGAAIPCWRVPFCWEHLSKFAT
jgi:hypothetical protein